MRSNNTDFLTVELIADALLVLKLVLSDLMVLVSTSLVTARSDGNNDSFAAMLLKLAVCI